MDVRSQSVEKINRLLGHLTTPEVEKPRPFVFQTARASWIAPLLAYASTATASGASDNRIAVLALAGVATLLIISGFTCAVFTIVISALFGPRKLLIPASIGLFLNGLFLILAISAFQHVGQKAKPPASRSSQTMVHQSLI